MAAGKPWLLWLTLMAAAVLPAQAQQVFYVHTDALGSVVAVTDANGDVVKRSEYEPYGRVLNRPVTNGPGYTGHVEDAATGLTYMQQRYYDPGIGRFLSVDPVTADGNTGGNFNRYWYANNNPYKFTDPDGRLAMACAIPGPMQVCMAIGAVVADVVVKGMVIAAALWVANEVAPSPSEAESPTIDPADVAGNTPAEIDAIANEAGLIPKGPDPSSGLGAYVDPGTGKQRILVHPNADCGPHCHVNDADGNRLDIGGNIVAPESPEAHLPLKAP